MTAHHIDTARLDSAWNRYGETGTALLQTFQDVLPPDVGGVLAKAFAAHEEAAQAVREANADAFTVLALWIGELRELQAGLQVEAGLSRRVEDLEAQVQVAQADILAIASRTAEFEARL